MATITSNVTTANWNVGGSWVGGVAPGDGDSAIIASGAVITIPVGVTVTVGTAPATGGTAAVTATGRLIVNGTLNAKGDVVTTNASGITCGAGSTINQIVGTGVQYNMSLGTGYGTYSPLICNGTSGSPVTITATLTGTGVATLAGGTANSNGHITATYTNFSNLGSASVKAANWFYSGARSTSLTNCTITNCGQFFGSNMADGDSMILANTKFDQSLHANCFQCDNSTVRTTGTRSITNCVFDTKPYIGCNFACTDTMFKDAYYLPSTGSGKGWSSWSNNYVGKTTSAGSALATCYDVADTIFMIRDSNAFGGTSVHGIDPSSLNQDSTIQRCVFDGVCVDVSGDWILPTVTAPGASTYYLNVYDNVYLPNPLGVAIGTPLTLYGNNKLKVRVRRNTYAMGTQGLSYAESYVGYANMVELFVSNIAWNSTAGSTGWKVWDALGSPFDAAAGVFTTADYNGGWNFSTSTTYPSYDAASLARGYQTGSSAGANYAFQAGTTPGDHDVSGDPQFYDSTRCIATFDQDYLSKSIGTAWATGTAYAVGDMVSASTTGAWGSRSINFRCILAHTSSSGSSTLGKPGAGTAGSPTQWSTRWQLASEYWMEVATVAGTTYTDSTIGVTAGSVIETARKWIRYGFSPQSSTYNATSGYGGEQIGAVAYLALSASGGPPAHLGSSGPGMFFNSGSMGRR